MNLILETHQKCALEQWIDHKMCMHSCLNNTYIILRNTSNNFMGKFVHQISFVLICFDMMVKKITTDKQDLLYKVALPKVTWYAICYFLIYIIQYSITVFAKHQIEFSDSYRLLLCWHLAFGTSLTIFFIVYLLIGSANTSL